MRPAPTATPDLPSRIGGHELTDLRELGVSRAGTPSWLARHDGRQVRLMRCRDGAHARLIEWVSGRSAVAEHFPHPLGVAGDVLVVEWIEGETPDKRALRGGSPLLERLGGLLARLHAIEPPAGLATGPLYLSYLWERWERVDGPRKLPEVDAAARRALDETPTSPMRLSLPDLAPHNLVLGADGLPISVDNELLASSAHPAIDLFNPWRYFGRGLRARRSTERFLRAYARSGGELEPLLDQAPAVLAVWRLRRLGSLLEDGRDREARAESAARKGHPILTAAARLLDR